MKINLAMSINVKFSEDNAYLYSWFFLKMNCQTIEYFSILNLHELSSDWIIMRQCKVFIFSISIALSYDIFMNTIRLKIPPQYV